MKHPKISVADMLSQHVLRFKDVMKSEHGIPLMFIDSILPGHQRMNYSVIGDTASENPDFKRLINVPHKFQIGMVCAPPHSGPAYHTHDYIELFVPLTGQWRFYFGNDENEPEGEVTIGPWDIITLPPGLWRGFENISKTESWIFAVLEPHEVFRFKDPIWSPKVITAAEAAGFRADESGKMIQPTNYAALKKKLGAKLQRGVNNSKTPYRKPTVKKTATQMARPAAKKPRKN